jgi:excisionase family DNA binding protein
MALFYTLEEAASLLGTSTSELRNRIQSKQVHALLIGGSWRLRIADIHGLMKSRNIEVAPQVPESPVEPAEAGDKKLSVAESVPHAPVLESVPHAPVLESPPHPSIEISAGASTPEAPVEPTASSSLESLRQSLIRVLELARSQGMLLEGARVETASGSPSHDQEQTKDLDENGSEDGLDPSGPSQLEELFQLALKSELDEESETEESPRDSSTEPSSAQAMRSEESKGNLSGASTEASGSLESELSAVTEKHPDGAVLGGQPRGTTAAAKNAVSPAELPKAKGPRAGQGGFFPVECPSCQALGQVPPNRMDQQLKCAECGTKFYLDLITNETIIGEKVIAKVAEPVVDKRPIDSKGIAAVDAITNLSRKTQLHIAVTALATIGLALGLYYFWPRVGNTPSERSAEVLRALIHNKPGRVSAIAVPSSRGDVEAWFRKVRPKDWPEVQDEIPADINVVSVKKQARATTSIDFPPSVAIMPGSQLEDSSGGGKSPAARSEFGKKPVGSRGLSLLLSWKCQNGQWLFDATESLKKPYPPK